MKQLSLVAYYGQLPEGLASLIVTCQSHLQQALDRNFHPVPLSQVHATIISLERHRSDGFINRNFANFRNESKEMNFDGLLNYFRANPHFPLKIQIGGFERRDYGFESRQESPYSRSFNIQKDIAVLVGWAVDEGNYPRALYQIRKDLEAFNFLHSYHPLPSDYDNDFYMRIGYISAALISQKPLEIEESLRAFLSAQKPIVLPLTINELTIISYEDPHLPVETTHGWKLDNPLLTAKYIQSLY